MKVTDKDYYLEDKYKEKLDLMIKRMTGSGTDDNILIIDGDEGQGKSEFATGTCYYVAYQTGRKYDVDNIFFKIDDLLDFAINTEDQIIHFDEGALGLLTTQWWRENNQKFLQLVMTARKKRHFMVICIPKFYKLNPYMIEERSIALIHIYSRNNLQKGRFCYYTKSSKEKLYEDWKRRRIKTYKKHYSFHGSFVMTMKKVLGEEGLKAYDTKKDEAIMSINDKKEVKSKLAERFKFQRDKLITMMINELSLTQLELSERLENYDIDIKRSQISEIIRGAKVPVPIVAQ